MPEIHALQPAARAALQQRALAALSAGRPDEDLARELYVPRPLVAHWWRTHQETLRTHLARHAAPRSAHRGRLLLRGEQAVLRSTLLEHRPAALGLNSLLWTHRSVAELAHHMFRARLRRATLSSYLRSWGWSFPRPGHDARHALWREEVWPHIRTTARIQGARVLYAQHASRPLDPRAPARSPRVTVLAAQTPLRNSLWFALYARQFSTPVLLEFLTLLLRQVPGPLHLVVPPETVGANKKTNAWLARHAGRLTVHQIPATMAAFVAPPAPGSVPDDPWADMPKGPCRTGFGSWKWLDLHEEADEADGNTFGKNTVCRCREPLTFFGSTLP